MNNIEFVCSDKVVLRNFPIVPAKDLLPEWYEKLKADSPNISKCWPVRDIITAGYIIPYPFETEMGIESGRERRRIERERERERERWI